MKFLISISILCFFQNTVVCQNCNSIRGGYFEGETVISGYGQASHVSKIELEQLDENLISITDITAGFLEQEGWGLLGAQLHVSCNGSIEPQEFQVAHFTVSLMGGQLNQNRHELTLQWKITEDLVAESSYHFSTPRL